jgi:hypothetical protein
VQDTLHWLAYCCARRDEHRIGLLANLLDELDDVMQDEMGCYNERQPHNYGTNERWD